MLAASDDGILRRIVTDVAGVGLLDRLLKNSLQSRILRVAFEVVSHLGIVAFIPNATQRQLVSSRGEKNDSLFEERIGTETGVTGELSHPKQEDHCRSTSARFEGGRTQNEQNTA